PGDVPDLVNDSVGVRGVVEFQVKDRGLVLRAVKVLKNSNLQELAGAFSLLDDAGDAEVVIQDLDGIADLDVLGFCEKVIDEDVVGRLERASAEVVERAQAFVGFQIDAGDYFESSGGHDLSDHGRHGFDVRQFGQDVADLDRHGSAGQTNDERRTRRHH